MKLIKDKKDTNELIVDELLDAYVEDLSEEDMKEFEHLFETDEQYLKNRERYGNYRYEHPKRKFYHIAKYVAAILLVFFIVVNVVPLSEASAWRIWTLDFWFGEEDDHTVVKPSDKFPQYYVSEVLNGFSLTTEFKDDNTLFYKYKNNNNEYIDFYQTKKDHIGNVDNEQRESTEDQIGDFDVKISNENNGEVTIFLFSTDTVVITIQTNAGYEIGKDFILNLKEF